MLASIVLRIASHLLRSNRDRMISSIKNIRTCRDIWRILQSQQMIEMWNAACKIPFV